MPNISDISQNIELSFQDCVVKSGIAPEIYALNFEPATTKDIYDLLYHDTDPTTNSSSGSAQAKRNYTKCENVGGWIANGRFRQLSGNPIAFEKKQRPRKYFQPAGKTLELFFARITVAIWELVARKNGLSMPEFPVVGVGGEALHFWDWVKTTNCQVILTEGEKKAASLMSRGYVAIGLPGISTGYRVTEYGEKVVKSDGTEYRKAIARELVPSLQEFDTPGREIVILFDYRTGDYSQNPEFKAACTTAKLFKNAIAKVAILPGPDKGIDDFLVAGGDVDAVISEAKQQTSEIWQLKKWLKFRGFSTDRKINAKYFDAPAPESDTITAIKSGLGTGKSQWINRNVASDKTGVQINISYRNNLLLQQSAKWGFYHLDEHNGYQFFSDPNARLSLCFDSLLKIPIEMFVNATIILDESASSIKHLISSRTLSDKRLEVLEKFEAVCKICDRIVLSDGNQSDLIVDYVKELSGKNCTKIENDFAGDAPPVFFAKAGKKNNEWFIHEILKSNCPAVATDSLREAETIAFMLEKQRGPGLLLSSKTTEKWVKEFLADPDKYIEVKRPNWIVYTPTAESGIDISIPEYFSDVFCWYVGVIRVDECLQMSRRVRNPERIVVLCPSVGFGSRNKSGFFESEIIKAIADFGDTEARLLVEDESQLQKIKEDLATQITTPHTKLWAKLQAKAELERVNLREYLVKAFEFGGYSVQSIDPANCTDEGYALAKQEAKDIEAQEIFNAHDIEVREALEIKRNYGATWSDRCKSIKCLLKARFPGIECSDLWTWEFVRRVRFEERSLLSQLDAAWVFENPEDAEYLQRSKWLTGQREFLGDFSERWLKIKALKALGLERFLEPDRIWRNDSPEILELVNRCKKKALANLLGHPGKMKPMQWLNQLLSLIGVKLVGKNVKRNGVQHREYSYISESSRPANWDELAAFTDVIQAKKIKELKAAEALAAQGFEMVAPPPVFDTNLEGDATIPKEAETAVPDPPIEPSTPTTEEAWGWLKSWGKWVRGRAIGWCQYGTRYRLLIEKAAGIWGEILAFPDQIHWEQHQFYVTLDSYLVSYLE